MPGYDAIQTFRDNAGFQWAFPHITAGTVIDTNDPLQAGRIRVFCPALGDTDQHLIEDIPWCSYVSPFGGSTVGQPSGTTSEQSIGTRSYGFWAIPQVGSTAIIACLDGNVEFRLWIGCITVPSSNGGAPHGIYKVGDQSSNPQGITGTIQGPLTDRGEPIQPLYNNYVEAFIKNTSKNGSPQEGFATSYEWLSRGVDYSASATTDIVNNAIGGINRITDDSQTKITLPDGTEKYFTQGYGAAAIEADQKSNTTGSLLESTVYHWTTPGFHAISMDDRPENCRMRFRTAAGHQILMDDTNERIYIMTCRGGNWIELDQAGNIDIYSESRISISSDSDINITADGSFRVQAAKGIHMTSGSETRITSASDISIQSPGNLRMLGSANVMLEATGNMNVLAGANLNLSGIGTTNILSSGELAVTSGGVMSIGSGGNINLTGGKINLNGPAASVAKAASPAAPRAAYLPNRTPEHEPWARSMFKGTDNDGVHADLDKTRPKEDPNNVNNKQEPEMAYDHEDIGRMELGNPIGRGPFWSR